ncbi:hypothetical protein SCUP234_13129 [Seiridium cupressi]
MSSAQPTPGPEWDARNTTTAGPSSSSRPPRVLSCTQCHQRKVKCDRKFPCANCRRAGTQCVQATLVPRRRRRKFAEHELLDRIRTYERLLHQNNVKFEPLRKNPAQPQSSSAHANGGSDSEAELRDIDQSSDSKSVQSHGVHTPKDIWKAMRQEVAADDSGSDSSDDAVNVSALNRAWDQIFANVKSDKLLFGSRETQVDLTALHPEPAHIFRLWQVYLDNVNPLLKATHTPTLQRSIIEATGNMSSITPTLEALMFSIYSVAISSLSVDDCQAIFGSRDELSIRYQFGCQQALANCGFLRTDDRNCLTALYLYLVSTRLSGDYRSLSSMLGVAMRIAQRMSIDKEEACAEHSIHEAEMRRRLWWSITHFDARMGDLANTKSAILSPTWDCNIPLNVDDSDLQLELSEQPLAQARARPTEAIFAVVRSELAEFVRHSTTYLDFTNPALKPIARPLQGDQAGSGIDALEKTLHEKYLKFCDLQVPLHFITIWMTRGWLARCRLHESYWKYSDACEQQTEDQRDEAISHAIHMLVCDTKIMTSNLTKGYIWLLHFHFQFPAYMHITRNLKKYPFGRFAEQAWQVMSDNGVARFGLRIDNKGPMSKLFCKMILQAWGSRETVLKQSGEPFTLPQIVSSVSSAQEGRDRTDHADWFASQDSNDSSRISRPIIPAAMPMAVDNSRILLGVGRQANYTSSGPEVYTSVLGQAPLDLDTYQLDWSAMDWNGGNWPSF